MTVASVLSGCSVLVGASGNGTLLTRVVAAALGVDPSAAKAVEPATPSASGVLLVGNEVADTLRQDLVGAGLADTQADALVQSAKDAVASRAGIIAVGTSLHLTEAAKEPVVDAMPAVIHGAISALASAGAQLTDAAARARIAGVIMGSTFKSLHGRTGVLDGAATLALATDMAGTASGDLTAGGLGQTDMPQGAEAIAAGAVAALAGAGLPADVSASAAGAVLSGTVAKLAAGDLPSSVVAHAVGRATGGAMGALASGGLGANLAVANDLMHASFAAVATLQLPATTVLDVVKAATTGAVGALDEAGFTVDAMSSTIDQITATGVTSLAAAGVAADAIGDAAGSVAGGAMAGLHDVGPAADGAGAGALVATVMTSTVGHLDDAGLASASITAAMSVVMSRAVGAIAAVGDGGAAAQQDSMGALMQGAMAGVSNTGITSQESWVAACKNLSQGAVSGMASAGVDKDSFASLAGLVAKVGVASLASAAASTGFDFGTMAGQITQGVMLGFSALRDAGAISSSEMMASTSVVTAGAIQGMADLLTHGAMSAASAGAFAGKIASGATSGLAMGGASSADLNTLNASLMTSMVSSLSASGVTVDNTALAAAMSDGAHLADGLASAQPCASAFGDDLADATFAAAVTLPPTAPIVCTNAQSTTCPKERALGDYTVSWLASGTAPVLCQMLAAKKAGAAPAPILAAILDGPSSVASATTVVFHVSGAATYLYKVGNATDCADPSGYTTPQATATLSIDVSGRSDGALTLCLLGRDAAGNTQASASTWSWTKDTTPPTITTFTPTQPLADGVLDASDIASAVPLVNVAAADANAATLVKRVWVNTTAAGCAGATPLVTTLGTLDAGQLAALTPGSYVVCASVTDTAGNTATASAISFVIPTLYAIGGSVTGLTGGPLTLHLASGPNLTLSANGAYAFAQRFGQGTSYAVSVASAPNGLTCLVANASGTIGTSDVANVAVNCMPPPVLSDLLQPRLLPTNAVARGATLSYDFNNISVAQPGDDAGMTYACTYRRVVFPAATYSPCSDLSGAVSMSATTGALSITATTSLWGALEFNVTGTLNGQSASRTAVLDFQEAYNTSNLLTDLDAAFAAMDRPGQNAPSFTSTWKSLTNQSARDGALHVATTDGWHGAGTTASPHALQLNAGDYVDAGSVLSSPSSFAFDTWINPSAVGTTEVVLSNGDAQGHGFTLRGASTGQGKYELMLGDGSASTGSSLYVNEVLADSPALYWRLGESTGSVALDSSGHGINGTYSGTYSLAQAGALKNDTDTGVRLDNGYVFTGNVSIGTTATIETWAQMNANPPNSMLWVLNGSGGPDLFFYSNLLSLNTWDAAQNAFCPMTSTMYDGQFHHYVTVFDAANAEARQYVDGVLCGTAGYRNPSTSYFSLTGDSVGFPWLGVLDETAVYNTALSAARIQAHFAAGGGTARCLISATPNAWQHVAGAYDSGTNTLKGYLNGVPVCSLSPGSATFPGSSAPLTLGRGTLAGGTPWQGQVGSLRVYASASDADIATNFDATLRRYNVANVPTSGLVAWFKIDDANPGASLFGDDKAPTAVSTNGAAVGLWKDQGSGQHDLAQDYAGARPTLAMGAINGHPALTFDGGDDFLMNSTYYPRPFTFFVVQRMLTGGAHERVLSAYFNNWLLGFWGGNKDVAYMEGWLVSPSVGAVDDEWRIHMASSDANGAALMFVNGAEIGAGGAGDGPNGLELGGGGGGEFSHAQVAEVIGYDRALTPQEIAAVYVYLNARYAVY